MPTEILPNMLQPFYYTCKRSYRVVGTVAQIKWKVSSAATGKGLKKSKRRYFCRSFGSGIALKIYFRRISSQMPVQLMGSTMDLYFLCEIKKATWIKYTLCNAIEFSLKTKQKQRHACFWMISGNVQLESLGM